MVYKLKYLQVILVLRTLPLFTFGWKLILTSHIFFEGPHFQDIWESCIFHLAIPSDSCILVCLHEFAVYSLLPASSSKVSHKFEENIGFMGTMLCTWHAGSAKFQDVWCNSTLSQSCSITVLYTTGNSDAFVILVICCSTCVNPYVYCGLRREKSRHSLKVCALQPQRKFIWLAELKEEPVYESSKKGSIAGAVALVIGTSIGSGILTLPKKTSPAVIPHSI